MPDVAQKQLALFVIAGMTKTEVFNELKINPISDYTVLHPNYRNIKIINKFYGIVEFIDEAKKRCHDIETVYKSKPLFGRNRKYNNKEIIRVIELLNEVKKQQLELKA